MARHDLLEALCCVIQGFIPAHPAPLALAPFPVPDHGVLRPFRVLNEGNAGAAPGAEPPFKPRRMGVALQEINFVACHFHLNRTADGTHTTDAIDLLASQLNLPIAL